MGTTDDLAERDRRQAYVRERAARQVYDVLTERRPDDQLIAGSALVADRIRAVAMAERTKNPAMIRQAYMDLILAASDRVVAIDLETTYLPDYGSL